jgi:trimeric autotransporter adhesin
MKIIKGLVWLAVAAIVTATGSAWSQGTAFTYQGQLLSGAGLANGSYDLRFAVYDAIAGGNLIAGPQTNSATGVTNGLFTVALDFGSGVFTGPARWLEIGVRANGGGSFTTLSPRQPLMPAPYAIMANTASNLLGTLPTAQLTGTFPASQLSGTIPAANLAGTYGNAVNFNNGANDFDGTFFGQFFGSTFIGGSFTGQFIGDGSSLSGVGLLNGNQIFNGQNVFMKPVGFGNPAPVFSVDVLAYQAVGRFVSTNHPYGSVVELRNLQTNGGNYYLGAVNFNNAANATPGQIGYTAGNSTNSNNDYLEFRVGGTTGLRIQADPFGYGLDSVIGGYNSISGIASEADSISGGYGNSMQTNVQYSFIGGGWFNSIEANNQVSFIGGGNNNTIQSSASGAIIGGGNNSTIQTNADHSIIAGGWQNLIEYWAYESVISGGELNDIGPSAQWSVIGGGEFNTNASSYSTIGGGKINSIDVGAISSTIGGGYQNAIHTNSFYSTIAGGLNNSIQGTSTVSVISGGWFNKAQSNAHLSVIGGGLGNTVSGIGAVISGGGMTGLTNNTYWYNPQVASGTGSVIPGGAGNTAAGDYSFAAGWQAKATNNGAFVWADTQPANFYSTTNDQFNVRAQGGVRFETSGAGLTVDGQPVIAGVVGTGQLSGPYVNPVTLSNPGNSFTGNGAGLANVNAATLGGLPASSFAQLNSSPSFTGTVSAPGLVVGNAQVTGLLRSGSETGTSESPSPAGMVVRRINSTTFTSNSVVAVTRSLGGLPITLVRDGTVAGFQIQYPAAPGNLTIACMGIDNTGTPRNFYTSILSPATAGTVQIYSNALNVEHFECTFGLTFNGGQHLTQVTLSRYGTDYFWSGTLISTYNQ